MAKLLLVEDDNNLREIYEARLQAEGYTIVSARDGEEALVVAKAEKPDLVLADVMMPKISGFEMLDIMHNTDELRGVKVIMLTALGQSDDQQKANKLGADRYLVKSQVTLEDIVKVVHELLEDKAAPAAGSPAPKPDTAAPASAPAAPPAAEPAATEPAAPAAEPEPAAPAAIPITEPPAGPPADDSDAGADKDKVTESSPSPSRTDGVAKSTVQEEADVEAKIEDFVAGATTEPTKPESTPDTDNGAGDKNDDSAPAAASDTDAQAAPSTTATKNTSSASDDKLMSDAVDTLVASTDKSAAAPAKAAPAATVIPVSIAPDSDKDTLEPPEPDKPSDGAVSHKKVIKPLESQPKKDIKALLAEEEAEEAKKAKIIPGATIASDTTTALNNDEDKASGQPSGSAAPTSDGTPGGTDPGGIAL
jgi:CheY-like chemotaxis protein